MSIIPVCNALSKSMRPSKGGGEKDPNRMNACYFGVGEEGCLDPPCALQAVLLPQAERVHCEEVGENGCAGVLTTIENIG